MSNFICSFECQISRRTIDKFLVVVLVKGAMKRPSSALTVALVKKAGKVKAKTSNAALQDQKGKAATKKLTQGALKAHEELLKKGAKDENEALLEFGKLDKNAQQSLWKAFELQRKSAGVNDDYKSHVGTGAGIMAKKKQTAKTAFSMLIKSQKQENGTLKEGHFLLAMHFDLWVSSG